MAVGGMKVASPDQRAIEDKKVRDIVIQLPPDIRSIFMDERDVFDPKKFPIEGKLTNKTGNEIYIVFQKPEHRNMVAEAIDYVNKLREAGGLEGDKKPLSSLPYKKAASRGLLFYESALNKAENIKVSPEVKPAVRSEAKPSIKLEAKVAKEGAETAISTKSTSTTIAPTISSDTTKELGETAKPLPGGSQKVTKSKDDKESEFFVVVDEDDIEERMMLDDMKSGYLKLIKNNSPKNSNTPDNAVKALVSDLNGKWFKKELTDEQFNELRSFALEQMRSKTDPEMRYPGPSIDMFKSQTPLKKISR